MLRKKCSFRNDIKTRKSPESKKKKKKKEPKQKQKLIKAKLAAESVDIW